MGSINNSTTNIHCIITRYNEHLDWVQYIRPEVSHIFIYNKGDNDNLFKNYQPSEELLSKMTIIKLENIGRIDHTLAYHILEHWDSLPDSLISLPGTVMMTPVKGKYFSMMMKIVRSGLLVPKYKGFYAPRRAVGYDGYNFTRIDYQASGLCNRNNNPFIRSEYPDLQTWKNALIDNLPLKYIAYRGMFMVARDNILFIEKKVYENLLESLSVGDNIENGHYAERIWAHIFLQFPESRRNNVN